MKPDLLCRKEGILKNLTEFVSYFSERCPGGLLYNRAPIFMTTRQLILAIIDLLQAATNTGDA
ncbi:hypothetical protein [Azonexus sp.]|jgi:hypothetical protein|uniref:hypothetical protein n=1 Tax=Azonexus sp. TaxID=1872668 RepID=UPI002824A4A7|nr:hypothetical protein [Azonexus sp.]MDR1996168.1 hypothetical protein [Azonexus sp.]